MRPTRKMAPKNQGMLRFVLHESPLKLGYLRLLTIRKERSTMRHGNTHLHAPSSRKSLAFELGSISSSVTELMTPAAAGMGHPVKSRLGLLLAIVARQLNLARRMAPQST